MNKPSIHTLLQNFESEQVQRELRWRAWIGIYRKAVRSRLKAFLDRRDPAVEIGGEQLAHR